MTSFDLCNCWFYNAFFSWVGSLKFGDSLCEVSTVNPWKFQGNQCHHPLLSRGDPIGFQDHLYLAALWPWQVKDPLDATA